MVEARPTVPFPVIIELNTLVFCDSGNGCGNYLNGEMWQKIKSLLLALWASHPCL